MFLNSGGWLGGSTGGTGEGGGGSVIIQGSQHYNLADKNALNALTGVSEASTAFIISLGESYSFHNNTWILTAKLNDEEIILINSKLIQVEQDLNKKLNVEDYNPNGSSSVWEEFSI